MPPSFKIDDLVQRKLCKCTLLNSTITGKIVECCENKLFLKILWENNTDATLEYKRNLQRVASVIPQTSQTRQHNYNARVAPPKKIAQTSNARQILFQGRKKVLKTSSDSPPKQILKASSDSPPSLPETPQARQKKFRTRKKAYNNFNAPINKDARNVKVF